MMQKMPVSYRILAIIILPIKTARMLLASELQVRMFLGVGSL